MGDFFGYRGQIAHNAVDKLRSNLMADLLGSANFEDLRTISLECRGDVLHIAEDMNGSFFLKRLFERLGVLTLVYELQSILEALVGDQRFITSLCRSESCIKTLFSLLELLPEKKQEVIASILPTLLMCNENVEQFVHHLFMLLTETELEPIVNQLISGSFTELARHEHGHKNLFLVIQSVGYARVIMLLPPDFWFSACDKNGNRLLQTFVTNPEKTIRSAFVSKLTGRFDALSRDKYANFLVKACLDCADKDSCDEIYTELHLSFHTLVTHPYGNYVVQQVLRNVLRTDGLLPPTLRDILFQSRGLIENDKWGKEVLHTFDKLISEGFRFR